MKPFVFDLRAMQHERTLSMYLASLVETEDILAGAPGHGWGVISLRVADVRRLGFKVVLEPDSDDVRIGHAHVAVMPPEYDETGQIPAGLRARLALHSSWAILPDRSAR